MNLDLSRTRIVFEGKKPEQGIQATLYPRDENLVIRMTFDGFAAHGVFSLDVRRAPGKQRPAPISADEMRRVADAYPLLVDYVRAEILWEHDRVPALHDALRHVGRREPGTRERLTDEAIVRYVLDVRALERAGERYPDKALAERYGISPSNVSRRRKRAIELGYF